MIEIDVKIVSADLLRECFACDIAQCKGICCVEGNAGAPLEADEVEILEPGQPPYKLTVAEIRNGEGESVPAAPHAMLTFSMPCPEGSFTEGTSIRKYKN